MPELDPLSELFKEVAVYIPEGVRTQHTQAFIPVGPDYQTVGRLLRYSV